ncbi:N-acetylmuramoyl-L-alanine amidase [Nocardioides daejeonensis]|uniref:N-acetylmuramoyl-L-alanine amidase n=1 Tax=Nocardioides daejeonensis TaxID=1046556 RepID=UPI000D749247|nr:N-acetylmuramoyl-L-alanine amidase [Nocardioides daejeonensis]
MTRAHQNTTTRLMAATAAVGLLIPLSAAVASAAPERPSEQAADGPVTLQPEAGGVAAVEVPLATRAPARRAAGDPGVQIGEPQDTSTFSQVAVTWKGTAGEVAVRTRSGGRWTGWQELEPLEDGPDRGQEVGSRQGSDLLWVGASDGVQVRTTGAVPQDLTLVLQQPTREPAVAAKVAAEENEPAATNETAAPKKTGVPRPAKLMRRKDWGANKKWRNGKPAYNSSLMQVHVHHTASSNDYAKADVAGIIRGMYRYHTKSLGWFDIGYNFLVDKFGRMWVGRSGGAGKLVRGAHTLGFNHDSTGIAVIGNFESATPSEKVLRGVAKLAAWKLDKHGAPKAKGKVKVTSTGSDLYRSGTTVRLPAIDGHRDTNQTACPGANLYKRLKEIRTVAQRRLDRLGR